MQKLRINPLVAADLKEVCNFIADNNEAYAVKTISEIYKKFLLNYIYLFNYLFISS